MSKRKIGLVSCSKLKLDFKCKAVELYSKSNLFKKASSYAHKNYDKWFILSAKYGLLDPEVIVDTYDLSLNSMSKSERLDWSSKVFFSLIQEIKIDDEIYFHCGEIYRKHLIDLFSERNYRCHVPLLGMGIGQQLHFYTRE